MNNIYLLIYVLLPVLVEKRFKQLAAVIAIAAITLVYGGVAVCSILDVPLPLSAFEGLRLTPIASIFALVFCATILPTVMSERPNPEKSSLHYSIFYGSIITLFVSLYGILLELSSSNLAEDTVWPFVLNWELMGLSSFTMMLLKSRRREFFHSAILYFIVMHVGFFFILAGILTLDGSSGFVLGHTPMPTTSWVLMLIGFGMKSAIYPLYFWLPYTYRASLGAGAAIMAGTSTNVGLFGIITITSSAFDVEATSMTLIVLGLFSALFGSLSMIRATSISKVLSYSSVENLGVMLFGIGFSFYAKFNGATEVALLSMIGAMVKVFAHGVTKSSLLTIGGKVRRLSSSDRISRLGGISRRLPGGTKIFALGGMSLCGMPLFGSFIAEFLMFASLFFAVNIPSLSIVAIAGILVLALASASTVFNITKAFTVAFLGTARSEIVSRIKEDKTVMKQIGYALYIIMLTIGGWAMAYLLIDNMDFIFNFGKVDVAWIWEMIVGIAIVSVAVVVVVGLLWLWRSSLEKNREMTIGDTWGCGNIQVNQLDTQPTAESFSYEANVVASLPARKKSKSSKKRISAASYLRRWTFRLAIFQTGRTSHYVLHIILFLAFVLILTLCDVL